MLRDSRQLEAIRGRSVVLRCDLEKAT